ncbi:hypothetical protein CF319_g2827 [Tilletia indica]|nr:hypothetical protein CF319_g2827 [Tilletia indica]
MRVVVAHKSHHTTTQSHPATHDHQIPYSERSTLGLSRKNLEVSSIFYVPRSTALGDHSRSPCSSLMAKYLIGRVADPIFAMTTGVFAYVLWENDGRNAEHRPEGRKLYDLVKRRWELGPAASRTL